MRPSSMAAAALLLAACGGGAEEAGQGSTAATVGEVGGDGPAPADVAELDEPPPPGAETVLSRLEPARLDPTDVEQMQQVSGASAPRVFFVGLIPLMSIPGRTEGEAAERTCPETVEGDGVVVYRGGCTDEEGTRWTGSAVVRGLDREQRTGDITYRGFGFERTVECPDGARTSRWRADGRFVHEESRFVIDVAFEGEGVDEDCEEMIGTGGLAYEGRSEATGSAVRWNGSGRYGWEGFGVVEARTEDELVNQRNCRHEALMGTTTVRGAEHTVTLQYDGADDCDQESTVSWSFDDQPQGELAGVACSAGGEGGPAGGLWWAIPLAGWLIRPSRGRPFRSSRSA